MTTRSYLLGDNDSSDSESVDPLFAPPEEEDIFVQNGEVTGPLVLDAPSVANDTILQQQPVSFGAVANLCSATLGAGILALPFALYETGVVVGLVLLATAGALTAVSIDLLAHAASHVQYTGDSYEELAEIVLSQRRSIEICMLLFCVGCAVAYVMAVGDILAGILGGHSKLALVMVWATTMVPLSLLRSMNSLSFASSIGIASIGTLIFCSTMDYFILPDTASLEDFSFPSSGWKSVLTALPVVLFAFSCQPNVCTIYRELECEEGEKKNCMRRIAISSVLLCGGLYTAISLVVLATFGSEVLPNLLSNYHAKGTFMQVAVGAMALAVTLAFPLNIFPARVTLIGLWKRQPRRTTSAQRRQPHDNLTQALLEDAQHEDAASPVAVTTHVEEHEDEIIYVDSDPIHAGSTEDNDIILHYGTTLFLTTLTLVLALVLPNISVVFGLLGGTTSSWLGFVIPGWMAIRTDRPFAGYSLMIIGIIIGIVTTTITVYNTLM